MDSIDRVAVSKIGRAMLNPKLVKVNKLKFVKNIEKAIDNVEHNDWEDNEIKTFVHSMKLQTVSLDKGGAKAHNKIKSSFNFLTGVSKLEVENTNDLWLFAYRARAKTIAFNNKQVKGTPWEILAFDAGTLPGVALFNRLPDSVIAEISPARDALVDIIPADVVLLKEMQRLVALNSKDLCGSERSFKLEVDFLDNRAEPIIRERVHKMVLGALPDSNPDNVVNFDVTLKAIAVAQKSPQAKSLGVTIARDLDSLYDIVDFLKTGVGPKHKEVEAQKDFHKLCIKKLENFLFEEINVDDTGLRKKTLYGACAARHIFERVKTKIENNEDRSVDMKDLQRLKAYAWALPLSDANQLKPWTLRVSGARMGKPEAGLGVITDKVIGSMEIVPVVTGGGSAHSSDAKVKPMTKKDKDKEAKDKAASTSILKFFGRVK